MAIKVLEVDIDAADLPAYQPGDYEGLRVLARRGPQPLGWACFDREEAGRLQGRALLAAVDRKLLGTARADHAAVAWPSTTAAGESSPISVIICTRDRVELLATCLEAILRLDYPSFEVVVVDNAPRDDEAARLTARLPVRYVREDRPGLDWARNRGVAEARHDLIAFTDDDARPDRLWLRAMALGFARPEVMAVTGFVAPVELETRAQILFEVGYGGMGHGFLRREFHRSLLRSRDLAWASAFGVGANMAFRRDVFASVGCFDVALDVGTPTGGGGDIEMFHRVVAAGHTLLYEPSALVWHRHRPDMPALRRQIHANGRGFVAYLLTCARNGTLAPTTVGYFLARHWLGGWILRRLVRARGFPRSLILAELWGAATGPGAYRASRASARRLAGAASDQDPAGRRATDRPRGREVRGVAEREAGIHE